MSGTVAATGSMRAVILAGAGKIQVKEAERPQPGTGQVRVRLEGCGVCASNLTPWAGPEWMHFPTEPGALGHEGWGEIDALGEGVTELQVGERRGFLSNKDYAACDVADAAHVVKIPDRLKNVDLPLEPCGCAFIIFRRSDIREG